MITLDQLKKIIPTNKEPEAWLEVLLEVLPRYDINTPMRLAGFLAQTAHESADYKLLEENLNYSAAQLQKTWPKRFDASTASQFARKPEAIANKVYSDRMGNGSAASGDGWRFRGRGIKQLTGRDNYTAFGKSVGITAEKAAEYLTTKKGAVESAAWFWKTNNLNRFADVGDIVGLTKAINGGDIGLADRKKRYESAKKVLSTVSAFPTVVNDQITDSVTQSPNRTLRRGDRGDDVAALQKALNLKPDGVFGVGTEATLKSWQAKYGFVVDGIAGPKVIAKLLG
jgi:putative chitinase